MTRSTLNPWLHRFAVLAAGATLFLIWVGGLVTSHGVGMAVPDWPTTYGYNMFFFPISQWVGGIFYEHSHRLTASAVGFLTVVLAGWLALAEERRWLRRLGGWALALVLLQGLLGGLRVTMMKDVIGVFHATLAQMFFVVVCSIALFTSRWWVARDWRKLAIYEAGWIRYVFPLVTGMILTQLILGAAMRHQHAGLAIPDFPAAYGKIWPDMDAESVARYNQQRAEVRALNPITAFQIGLQMAHRLGAVAIWGAVAWLFVTIRRKLGWASPVTKLTALLFALVLAQGALGAATIWTQKAADIATAHVALGALTLVTAMLLAIIARRCSVGTDATVENTGRSSAAVPLHRQPANFSA